MEDPIAEVTAARQSRGYAGLAARETLTWSDKYRMWVAAHPNVVREVLESPDCTVRPRDARVPQALLGSRAGEVFGRLARMTEGDAHHRAKRAISLALDTLEPDLVRSAASRAAIVVLDRPGGSRFPFDISAYTLGEMFGVPADRLPMLAEDAGGFARCLSPSAGHPEISEGIAATDRLWQMIEDAAAQGQGQLALAMTRAFREQGLDHEATIANMIGFLFQAHDAVAGLIGNAVVYGKQSRAAGMPPREVVSEVASTDPSIQNTRRFVERDMVIAGVRLRAGDVVLVVLAADAAGSCPFGHGRHACPGQEIAITIAEAAVGELVRRDALPDVPDGGVTYVPSANARIPVFDYEPAKERRT